MNTISSVSSSSAYNPQITNKVAAASSANLANNAANQSAFSSYIGQALAQIGVANPTNASAPVVSGANKASAKEQESQKSVSTFIHDLFAILTEKEIQQKAVPVNQQARSQQNQKPENEQHIEVITNASATGSSDALDAYNSENSTTVGNIVSSLQTLVKQLNDANRNTASNDSGVIQTLKNDFQRILNAQGADSQDGATLGNFLQTLAQNLQGQSPLGIIINTYT